MHEIKSFQASKALDTTSIYNKIAPYLANPEFIKQFLKKNSLATRNEIIELIGKKIKSTNQIERTDLRILLNSI